IFGRKDYISIDSPMARALLKKEVGDLAVVNTPVGEANWYVNAELQRIAVIIFNFHPGAEEDFALLLRGIIHDFEIFHAFGQI
ncbi:GreA/GreB family elongation factor, partial [Salmonella enterica subsp. enterica serovar Virginia]|nr:GreA/GreB family elongation factor [Salmonella enterica subsp. enterica serovar Virginia]